MKKIRLLGLFLATTMIFSAVGCQKNNNPLDNLGGSNGTNSGAELFPFNDSVIPRNELVDAYADKEYGFQTELPENGEEVAVLHTNMGDICIRLFPEAAPKAVENFKTHIKNGYYDGLTFHRVINNFMIQGGDPEGNGTG
ncbi:MAG: peptidylprolyl isomerase, partial [Acutalibacteraceae bacterium]|nr:peptidylprolyl isomerase [Acutalibacteraceae bacterium]